MKSVNVVKIGSLKDKDEKTRGRVKVVDIPEQPMGEEDVRIKVAYCAICGSDPHLVEGIFGWEPPFGLGHELSGVIIELGKKATHKGLKVGDRIAGNFLRFCGTCYYCQNGQQQFCERAGEAKNFGMSENVVWHESQVYKLPDNVSLKQGCLLEPVSIAVRCLDKVNMSIGQRAAVCGGGPIGLLVSQALNLMGATDLTLIEPIAERRALAKKFGVTNVIDPQVQDVLTAGSALTDGRGFDVVIDCSGSVNAVYPLPFITAKGGKLIYAAMYPNDYEMPINLYKHFYQNEITDTGIYIAPYAYPRAMQIMPRFKLDELTSKVFPIDEAEAAFEAQVSGKYPKILIKCNEIPGE